MVARWKVSMADSFLRMILLTIVVLNLQCSTYGLLNLEGLALLAFKSKVEFDPFETLRNWDPHDQDQDMCKWIGVCCLDGKVEISGTLTPKLRNLKHLRFIGLPRGNGIQMATPSITILKKPSRLESNGIYPFDAVKAIASNIIKFGEPLKLEMGIPSHDHVGKDGFCPSSFTKPYIMQNTQYIVSIRRKLLETNNLPAASVTPTIPREIINIPSTGSGSFPAVPNSDKNGNNINTSVVSGIIPGGASNAHLTHGNSNGVNNQPTIIEKMGKWIYIMLPALVLLFSIVASLVLLRRHQENITRDRWKMGLSGQLQKALVTGVPRLNKSELEIACEDFSNIINTYSVCTVFKGTLSSGVEIAVISTIVSSHKDWSKSAETCFKRKIDLLSRVNHKNFVNLLGYCEENEPFMRMMVFEFAPNGNLYDHLHVKEFEHLDWACRMRIIMGVVYCLQHMYHELNPPVMLSDLQSTFIFLTDDYAAKVIDVGVWREVVRRNLLVEQGISPSELPSNDPRSTIYNFGILLLEIISGKVPYTEEQGSLLNWATEYLNDGHNIRFLLDPTLKNFKNDDLEILCEIIQECVHPDPKHRPTFKEVSSRLREVLAISPEAATPRLSPLWWAELEILSVEAT